MFPEREEDAVFFGGREEDESIGMKLKLLTAQFHAKGARKKKSDPIFVSVPVAIICIRE